MFTIVLTVGNDEISGRIENSEVAAQNTVGNFETHEQAVEFMNAMPELAALAVDVAHNHNIGKLRRTARRF